MINFNQEFLKFKKNKLIKSILYNLIDFPIVSNIYKQLYLAKIKKEIKKIKIENLTIEPFNVCNLRCIMCPYKKMTRPKVKMDMKTFKKVIDEAKSIGINKIGFTAYNEVFLDNLLFERIKYVKKSNMYLYFFSNGTVLNEEKIDKLLKYPPDKIFFSFDSNNKDTYEKIRIGAKFEQTRNNILRLINKRNEKKMKLPCIQISLIHMNLNDNEMDNFIKFWKNKADAIDFGTLDNRTDTSKLKLHIKNKSKHPHPCKRAFYDWGVLSDGRVTFCACQDYDGKFIIGDVTKNSLQDILHSKKYNTYKKLHLRCEGNKIDLCKNCTYLYTSATSWWLK